MSSLACAFYSCVLEQIFVFITFTEVRGPVQRSPASTGCCTRYLHAGWDSANHCRIKWMRNIVPTAVEHAAQRSTASGRIADICTKNSDSPLRPMTCLPWQTVASSAGAAPQTDCSICPGFGTYRPTFDMRGSTRLAGPSILDERAGRHSRSAHHSTVHVTRKKSGEALKTASWRSRDSRPCGFSSPFSISSAASRSGTRNFKKDTKAPELADH